jgi:capsid protein
MKDTEKHPARLLPNGVIRRDGKTVVRIVYADDEMAAAIVRAVEAEMERRDVVPHTFADHRCTACGIKSNATYAAHSCPQDGRYIRA